MSRLSPRLLAIVDGLPVRPGDRVLELGCGPGAAARELATRGVDVLAIDRSAAAIRQARAAAADPACGGRLAVRQVAAEDFELADGEAPFDLVFAVRLGALDGRHPRLGERVMARLAVATTADARLVVDGVQRPLRP